MTMQTISADQIQHLFLTFVRMVPNDVGATFEVTTLNFHLNYVTLFNY